MANSGAQSATTTDGGQQTSLGGASSVTSTPTTSDTTGAGGASSTTTATSTTGEGGAPSRVLPVDESALGISAFVEAQDFSASPWELVSNNTGSTHGEQRVYFSPALVQERTSNPDLLVAPEAPGVMAVLELLEANIVVGYAAIYYPAQGEEYYYCYGPEGRCASSVGETTEDSPLWGPFATSGVTSSCSFCHVGNIFTEL